MTWWQSVQWVLIIGSAWFLAALMFAALWAALTKVLRK